MAAYSRTAAVYRTTGLGKGDTRKGTVPGKKLPKGEAAFDIT